MSTQQSKKRLRIIQPGSSKVVEGTTCFAVHTKFGVDCMRQQCKNWIDHPEANNCVLIAVQKDGPHTLQKIGQIYGLTRMRICQIEKGIFEKIRELSL